MHVEESVVINADAAKISSVLNDFNQWQVWSPWLILEDGVKVVVADDGKSYSWEGERVGSGEMSIASSNEKEIHMDLTFLKPWKSKAKVDFEIKPNGSGTELTWKMDSSLPFFLFWMKKMMESLIGMDYERGLSMLKDYIEDGKVHSALKFEGKSTYPATKYVGIITSCEKEDIGTNMEKDFTKLMEFTKENNIEPVSAPFSIYNKMNMTTGATTYTAAIPVKELPKNLSNNMMSGELQETEVYSVKHTGPYKHLGNPWTAGYMMDRNKEIKINKKIPPFEVYLNDPGEVNELELETQVCFPLK